MQHQLVGSEESTLNTAGVNVNIDIKAEEQITPGTNTNNKRITGYGKGI
jgi:hypothetical protein